MRSHLVNECRNYEGLTFETPDVKFTCSFCKTHCNTGNYINITQRILGNLVR